jgi:hypothetical protein
MLNLVLNAVEALSRISEGSRELLISSEDGGTSGVCVAVHDSGPGPIPESFEHLFDASTRPSPAGWAWGYRSVVPSSKRTGQIWARANIPGALPFSSPCSARILDPSTEREDCADKLALRPKGGAQR